MHVTTLPEGLIYSLNLKRSELTHTQVLLNSVFAAQSCLYQWKCRANMPVISISVFASQLCIVHFYCWRVLNLFFF